MGNRYRSHFEDEKGLLRPNKTFVGNPSLEAYFGSFNVLAWSDPFRRHSTSAALRRLTMRALDF
ncbi:MAG: hypothetical protein DMG05_09135 [Acidobacteria bacterium]|nr:MAG: hypothetical protein DMG05_09135 [Acidobacteriota bacterium]